MRRSQRIIIASLGLLLIPVFLLAPTAAFAKDDLIADDDYVGGMEPGDPEGGDRIFDDTPFQDPNGTTQYIEDPVVPDRTIVKPEIRLILLPGNILLVIQTSDYVMAYPILRSR